MLYTDEIEDTIAFYVGILGFICGESNAERGWAALRRNECEIMLSKPNSRTLKPMTWKLFGRKSRTK